MESTIFSRRNQLSKVAVSPKLVAAVQDVKINMQKLVVTYKQRMKWSSEIINIDANWKMDQIYSSSLYQNRVAYQCSKTLEVGIDVRYCKGTMESCSRNLTKVQNDYDLQGLNSNISLILPSFAKDSFPIFDGHGDVHEWKGACETFLEKYRVGQYNKVFLAASHLKGLAWLWYDKRKRMLSQMN